MRIVANSLFFFGSLTSAVLLASCPATAKEPQYLLNCRLIDQTSDLYRRYCKGEKPHSKIVCQGDYCIIVVKNYVGRFGGNSEVTLAVPDGPAINDGVTTASVSALPNPGSEEPDGEEQGGEVPGIEESSGQEPGATRPIE